MPKKGSILVDIDKLSPREIKQHVLTNIDLMRSFHAFHVLFESKITTYLCPRFAVSRFELKCLIALYYTVKKGIVKSTEAYDNIGTSTRYYLFSLACNQLQLHGFISLASTGRTKYYSITPRGRKVIKDYSSLMNKLYSYYQLTGEIGKLEDLVSHNGI